MRDSENPEPGAWTTVGGEIQYLTLRISVKCEHCGQPIALNGPSRTLTCDKCLETSSTRGLAGALSDARKGMTELGSPFEYRTSKDPNPECMSCGTRVQLGDVLRKRGATTSIPCQKCGTPSYTYPVPKWLSGQFSRALQIFGGDPPQVDDTGSPTVAAPTDQPSPVLMKCPGCDAGLKIGIDAERTTECDFCKARVFIPDALWRSLHPAKTQEFWTISFLSRKRKKQSQNKQQGQNKKQHSQPNSRDRTASDNKNRRHKDSQAAASPSSKARGSRFAMAIALAVAIAAVATILWFNSGDSPPGGSSITPTGAPVTIKTKLHLGSHVQAESDGSWYRGVVRKLNDDGSVLLHFSGWDSKYDEDVPRKRLRLPQRLK